jgi:hypothetical protein
MIKNQTYNIINLALTKEVVTSYIKIFWDDVFKSIHNKKSGSSHLMILVKVEFAEGMGHRTLAHLRRVNFVDRALFTEYIVERLASLNDSYSVLPVSKITFSYIVNEGLAEENRALLNDTSDKELQWHRFNNMNLPITMKPKEYGRIVSTQVFNDYVTYIVTSGSRVLKIDVYSNKNEVTVLGPADLKWTDTVVSEVAFRRDIQKSCTYFMDGEVILRTQVLPAKPFRKGKKDSKLVNYFLTMDIETLNIGGKLVPYAICASNGTQNISSFLRGRNQKDLFDSFMKQLLKMMVAMGSLRLIVLAHNLSGFDGIFLMKHLLRYGEVQPLLFNGKIMSITLKLGGGKSVLFKDSYLLIPHSLRDLCKIFQVANPKTYFPFKLNDILYKGAIPAYHYWDITFEEYENLVRRFFNRTWSFQTESVNYCIQDCLALHQVHTQFNVYVFEHFSVNVHTLLTLPALAMRIFKANFMPDNTLFQINGDVEVAIRESFSGGAVDTFIPHNKIGSWFLSKVWRKLYYYDVNGLYPFIMATKALPIGVPTAFEGDIRAFEPEAFGFFYVRITTPDALQHPILQRRIKTADGLRTIAGLGTWEGWVCSAEMDRCIDLGYTFTIIRGYTFEVGDIFKDYIETMYKLRSEFPKGHPMNDIAKLLSNSLYGKFGMRANFAKLEIFKYEDAEDKAVFRDLLDVWGESVQDWIEVGDHLFVIRDSLVPLTSAPSVDDGEVDSYHGQDVNIAVASAITSYGRVYMSSIKNNPNFNLYYSDTDSAVTDAPLDDFVVGTELGQFKLEYVIKKAVFLAPKVYAFITEDGQEIVKIKGITPAAIKEHNIGFNDLALLLQKDSSRELSQQKWFKKVLEGSITVSDVAYTLKATSNKRQPIYVDGIFTDTAPYLYDNIKTKK